MRVLQTSAVAEAAEAISAKAVVVSNVGGIELPTGMKSAVKIGARRAAAPRAASPQPPLGFGRSQSAGARADGHAHAKRAGGRARQSGPSWRRPGKDPTAPLRYAAETAPRTPSP